MHVWMQKSYFSVSYRWLRPHETNGFCKTRTWIHHGYYYTIETQVYQEIDRKEKEIMLLYREEMSID